MGNAWIRRRGGDSCVFIDGTRDASSRTVERWTAQLNDNSNRLFLDEFAREM